MIHLLAETDLPGNAVIEIHNIKKGTELFKKELNILECLCGEQLPNVVVIYRQENEILFRTYHKQTELMYVYEPSPADKHKVLVMVSAKLDDLKLPLHPPVTKVKVPTGKRKSRLNSSQKEAFHSRMSEISKEFEKNNVDPFAALDKLRQINFIPTAN